MQEGHPQPEPSQAPAVQVSPRGHEKHMFPPAPHRVRMVPGWQTPARMHPLQQIPAVHCPTEHGVKSAALAPSAHPGAPVVPLGQVVVPARQGAPEFPEQAFPATQGLQAPLEQPLAQTVSLGV